MSTVQVGGVTQTQGWPISWQRVWVILGSVDSNIDWGHIWWMGDGVKAGVFFTASKSFWSRLSDLVMMLINQSLINQSINLPALQQSDVKRIGQICFRILIGTNTLGSVDQDKTRCTEPSGWCINLTQRLRAGGKKLLLPKLQQLTLLHWPPSHKWTKSLSNPAIILPQSHTMF